ncbi:MAG: imidazole glycerol phosphate synthase, glutamine amidotransferase subunit [Gammaproteobacteria bacterium RIFCSPLOWO2_02_FULL_57_10]|nr:MAG: imidazole glycerol phosphate synthase, glutamine amidotransferase subunit [Gammaproteobacteria bacterium RIFCSPLOWO2_02_FULL_57_10]
MNKVAVIDYGMGNLHSVAKALEYVGKNVSVSVTSDAQTILQADHVIFPGVGAIRDCMAEIRRLHIDEIVAEVIRSKPLLAVCVGMQALMDRSEENGGVDCLGMVSGQVRLFNNAGSALVPAHVDSDGSKLKVPHMGWNSVQQVDRHPLWAGIDDGSRFYFVHSYYVELDAQEKASGVTQYGVEFTAALNKGNIFAVQFHPEKSQHSGLQLLSNFLSWDGSH